MELGAHNARDVYTSCPVTMKKIPTDPGQGCKHLEQVAREDTVGKAAECHHEELVARHATFSPLFLLMKCPEEHMHQKNLLFHLLVMCPQDEFPRDCCRFGTTKASLPLLLGGSFDGHMPV
uniref:Uncharacterized protein n=1 Tax=Arundo donax TaxID=35708 RepID=A0A0A8ZX88_ARUDO